jgi:hypothetical protein
MSCNEWDIKKVTLQCITTQLIMSVKVTLQCSLSEDIKVGSLLGPWKLISGVPGRCSFTTARLEIFTDSGNDNTQPGTPWKPHFHKPTRCTNL